MRMRSSLTIVRSNLCIASDTSKSAIEARKSTSYSDFWQHGCHLHPARSTRGCLLSGHLSQHCAIVVPGSTISILSVDELNLPWYSTEVDHAPLFIGMDCIQSGTRRCMKREASKRTNATDLRCFYHFGTDANGYFCNATKPWIRDLMFVQHLLLPVIVANLTPLEYIWRNMVFSTVPIVRNVLEGFKVEKS
jgi:hypothetical protein